MKFAKLLHNPEAGEGEHTRKELLSLIRSAGYDCRYLSTKGRWWEKIGSQGTDFLVVAGGDGTIRKVAGKLLERKLIDRKLPVGLLPLGTANNVAKTLRVTGELEKTIATWQTGRIKKFDVGIIYGMNKPKFFLESIGYGVFPKLMCEMELHRKKLSNDPKNSVKKAWQLLHEIILSAKAKYCRINVDGKEYSGKFLLAEVMNTRSIGPNLHLAPLADPGDGMFNVVLISETQRDEFATYVLNKINGKDEPAFFNILEARNLQIYWEGTRLHIDDENFSLKKPIEIQIELHEGVLQFLTPAA